jgi:hypothetical protein
MITVLLIILLVILLGGAAAYYGHNRYGSRGVTAALGLVLIVLLALWLIGGFGGVSR